MNASAASLVCFHCGTPVPKGAAWSVVIEGVSQPMCCPGCEAVAQTIVANGLSDYYRTRTGFSPNAGTTTAQTVKGDLVPPELTLYDDPDMLRRFAFAAGAGSNVEDPLGRTGSDAIHDGGHEGDLSEAMFSIENVRCAACVWLIERRLAALPGVQRANLNVATERLSVCWQAARCKPSDILAALRAIGYVAYPFDPQRHGAQLQRAGRTLFRRLFVAGLCMMQVMMYAVPAYIATDGTMDADTESLMRWASLMLTLPAVGYSAMPFFHGAWSNLKARMLGMDVPVALGIAAAFGGSVAATVRGRGDVYFDSVTMFIFLLLCSRYLELLARRKAAASLEKLQHALPASALRVAGYPLLRETETVAAARLRQGDVILIKPGDAVAADCTIVEGETAIDMALLTGESRPQHKRVGDPLPGGAVNASQPVFATIARPVQESTLSSLLRMIERAGQAKPRLSLWADKVAAWFVGALLLLALAVFLVWHVIDPARAWPIAVAVLVVSCPCALSLATPTALAAAVDRLLRAGVLVVRPHVLETLHRATHVVFDKTGTLTAGRPQLLGIDRLGGRTGPDCLEIAGALEATSAHPLGIALADAARRNGPVSLATDVRHTAGRGLEGRVGDTVYRLGTAAFVQELAGSTPEPSPASDDGATLVYLGSGVGWLACFSLADALRADARQVVERFRREGREVVLLSGDRQGVTDGVARELGIQIAHGDCLPAQKLAYVQRLQADGAVVAMVGDGINDAAVLRAADVSFAMGSGAALAQMHADAVLVSGRLAALGLVDALAGKTMRIVRQNLAWATLYNLFAIPAAAFGLLNPWLSGVGMSLSSAIVVMNALRLLRIRGLPPLSEDTAARFPSAPPNEATSTASAPAAVASHLRSA